MSKLALAVPAGQSASTSSSSADGLFDPAVLKAGDKIGTAQVAVCRGQTVELRLPGELGFGRALIGLVPVVWCAAAWTLCLREHLLTQRMQGCLALSVMALVSSTLMASSLGSSWRFDGRRRRLTHRTGLFTKLHNARRLAGLKLETTRPTAVADTLLRMTLVDATGAEQFEVATWRRREVDRTQVEALAAAICTVMGWPLDD